MLAKGFRHSRKPKSVMHVGGFHCNDFTDRINDYLVILPLVMAAHAAGVRLVLYADSKANARSWGHKIDELRQATCGEGVQQVAVDQVPKAIMDQLFEK
jgi:hypothetical protein